jgi:predicted RNA-binding protein with PIN domain
MLYLIDGYNLLFTGAGRRPRDPRGLEEAREELVRLLARFHAARRGRSIVVFDCRKPFFLFGLPRRQRRGDVEIRFAGEETSADDVLRELIRGTRDAQAATAVTSDREILDAARARGMRTAGAKAFWAELAGEPPGPADAAPGARGGRRAGGTAKAPPGRPGPAEPPGKRGGLSESEVDYWMKEFGIGKDEPSE